MQPISEATFKRDAQTTSFMGKRPVTLVIPLEGMALPPEGYTLAPFALWMAQPEWYLHDDFPDCILIDGVYNDALFHFRQLLDMGVTVYWK